MPQTFLFVRSADRQLGSSSSFQVKLPAPYRSVTSCSLVSLEMPFAQYNLADVNLSGVRFTHAGTVYDCVLPAGFYMIDDLRAALLSGLHANLPAASVTAVTYTTMTGKLSFTYTSGQAFSVQAYGAGGLGRILGTSPAGVSTVAVDGVLSMPALCTLFPGATVLMKINELPTQCVTTRGDSCFARLQLASAPGSMVMLNNASSTVNTAVYATPVSSLSTLTVSLWSVDGQPLDIQGAEMTFTLMITSAA